MGNAASSAGTPRLSVAQNDQQDKTGGDRQPETAGTEQRPAEPFWQATFDDPVATFTLWLAVATTGLWAFTAALWYATFRLSQDAKAGGESQANKMEKSVAQAVRSADAMERVAESMAINADKIVESVAITREMTDQQKLVFEIQTRAYVHVVVGSAIYQETEKELKFAGIPVIINSGQTPAKRVRFRIRAGILPAPLPSDFVLDYEGAIESAEGMIPQSQDRRLTAFVDKLVPDEEIDAIMVGAGPRGLYVWGVISYWDAFDIERTTTFCHHLYFVAAADGRFKVEGFYTPGRNTAT